MTVFPKPIWRLSPTLNRAQLQHIAIAVGAPLTGTKPQVLANIRQIVAETKESFRINDGPKTPKRFSSALRVLSIDMGVRNLAYALLEHKLTGSDLHTPTLVKWQKLSLENSELSHGLTQEAKKVASKDEKVNISTKGIVKESFEPAHLAIHACRLARQFADFAPTHILIERQRFRSAGQAAVQEWSLRVGMLEAMLHATFQMLVEEKRLNAKVESILPARVNKYWFEQQDEEPVETDDVAAAENKRKIPTAQKAKAAKIALVTAMLQDTQKQTAILNLHPNVQDISKAFLQHKSSKRSSEQQSKPSLQLLKLDDLSDSLLQGLAWLHWQQNRLKITEE